MPDTPEILLAKQNQAHYSQVSKSEDLWKDNYYYFFYLWVLHNLILLSSCLISQVASYATYLKVVLLLEFIS